MRFMTMTNQSDSHTPPPPVLPPRDVPRTTSGGKVGLPPPPAPLSEVTDNISSDRRFTQSNTAALDYDHDFEKRFLFMALENLPPPEPWQRPLVDPRSDRSLTTT